jgi:hypothetical protein
MPALVAGIHVFDAANKTWIAGSSPVMTAEFWIEHGEFIFPPKIKRA